MLRLRIEKCAKIARGIVMKKSGLVLKVLKSKRSFTLFQWALLVPYKFLFFGYILKFLLVIVF